jgi:AcrR family transcriptional regulator
MSSHNGRERVTERPGGHPGASDAETLILDAAERLLDTVPLHELSVAAVIDQAGISRATFYFYFSSKFAVLTALVARITDEIYDAIQPYLRGANGLPFDAALERRIEASAAVWRSHRPVLRAAVENWHAFPELRSLWLGVIERMTSDIAEEIEHGRGQGLLPDSRQLAAVLAWTTERCLYVSGLGMYDFLPDEQAAVAGITSLWLAALNGDAVDRDRAA